MYVALTPRAGSGSSRSSVSASSSIAPRMECDSEKRSIISPIRVMPSSARSSAARDSPSSGVRVSWVVTESALTRRICRGWASTLMFRKSGSPFGWESARSASWEAIAATRPAGTIFSAPEMCCPSREARIFTE